MIGCVSGNVSIAWDRKYSEKFDSTSQWTSEMSIMIKLQKGYFWLAVVSQLIRNFLNYLFENCNFHSFYLSKLVAMFVQSVRPNAWSAQVASQVFTVKLEYHCRALIFKKKIYSRRSLFKTSDHLANKINIVIANMRWCFCFCSAELSWYATVTIAGGSETTAQSRWRSVAAAASLLTRWPRALAHFIFVFIPAPLWTWSSC